MQTTVIKNLYCIARISLHAQMLRHK